MTTGTIIYTKVIEVRDCVNCSVPFGAPEDFFDQIVQHEMVAAGERLDKVGGVFASLQRDRC